MSEQHSCSHPRGLFALSAAEMWERASFYSLKGILLYFMVEALGMTKSQAQDVQGWYVMAVYASAIPGGLIADKLFGAWWTVLIGGLTIIAGHFTLVGDSLSCFYGGLALIAVGTGLLKPNMTSLVGALYQEHDHRRERGYGLYYVAINVGATVGPAASSFLGQSKWFKGVLKHWNCNPDYSWHWAFAFAGVGMIVGLIVFVLRTGHLRQISKQNQLIAHQPLNANDWRKIRALAVFFVTTIIYSIVSEQGGSSLSFFADENTQRDFGWLQIPSGAFQAINPIFVLIFTPLFGRLWMRMGAREPTSTTKFALSMLFLGASCLFVIAGAFFANWGLVSPLWLILFYCLQVMGEVCMSPVGLSKANELSPARFKGLATGVWFMAWAIAAKLAGVIAGLCSTPGKLSFVFIIFAVMSFVTAAILLKMRPRMRTLMGDVL